MATSIQLSVNIMTKDTNKINLDKIEKLLSTSSTSSIYDTLSRIQLVKEVREEEKENKLGIDLNGFAKHTSLSNATQKEQFEEEEIIMTVSEPNLPPPSVPQESKEEKAISSQKVAIISDIGYQIGYEDILLTVAGKELGFTLKSVPTNKHSEIIKSDIKDSVAGIIILPPFFDNKDIQNIINKHVSELWSYNGLGPVPFVLAILEDNINSGSLALSELKQSIETFINNLTPVTRGNYGFGVKSHIIKELDSEKELKKILRSLSILLISYQRFKSHKISELT
jgi:hypothetical protein